MSYTITLTANFSNSAQDFTVAVESFSFAADNSATVSGGGGAGTGKSTFAPLTINKMLDANSPSLFAAVASGAHLPKVTLALTRTGSNTPDATYILTDALVTEIADSGNGHGGPFPMEQVAFLYSKIQIGSGGNTFTYDLKTGTAT